MIAPASRQARHHQARHQARQRRRVAAGAASGVARLAFAVVALALGSAAPRPSQAGAGAPGRPAISIIIDDLGYRRLDGLRAIELPGPVAYAVLPHTPYASRLATVAFQLDKEVLLHVPMESDTDKALGPGAITSTMSHEQMEAVLEAGLASVPHVSGINNHMGSALTSEAQPMRWVMQWLRRSGGLYFVDSLTSPESVALQAARTAGLAATGRDVFLDPTPDPKVIQAQFKRLIALARAHGTALGIGHPHPETLRVLRRVLLKPSYYGVELVPVHELIARRSRPTRAPRSPVPGLQRRAAYMPNSSIGH